MTNTQPTDPWDTGVRAVDVATAGRSSDDVLFPLHDDAAIKPSTAIDSHTVVVTLFRNKAAQSKRTRTMTLPQLAELIATQTASSKMELEWLKLATFGRNKSDKNCIRNNANVLEISGVEGDHDTGELSFDNAVAKIHQAGIRALLYTSASFVPGAKERWRILVPLSKNHPPASRGPMIARVNGLLGGQLADESFTLSQAFLFGSVNSNPNHRVDIIDGDFLDLRDDLHAGRVFKDGSRVDEHDDVMTNGAADRLQQPVRISDDHEPVELSKIEFALDTFSSNCSDKKWLKVAAGIYRECGESGFELFDQWSAKATGKAKDGTPMYAPEKALKRWQGARTMHSVTIATVFRYADEADLTWRDRYDDEKRRRIYADMAAGMSELRDRVGRSNGAGETSLQPRVSKSKAARGIKLDFLEDFDKGDARKPIIKGLMYKDERSSWIGPPGSGKSALLASVAIHVAEGIDWRGYRSKERVGVVYFALERAQLVKRRLRAHAVSGLPIAVAGGLINLMNASCVPTIIDTIRAAEAHFGHPVGLIIIDTVNKGVAAGGGDENSARDQNVAAANLQRVQDTISVHIALVGHTGKDESRGERGSNAQRGDIDMMVQISIQEGIRTATIIKVNDGMVGVLTHFKMKPITLGQDEDGDDITTAIVDSEEIDADEADSRASLNNSQRRAMELLERCIIDQGKPGPASSEYPRGIKVVPVETWRVACDKGALSPAGTKDSAAKAFSRAMGDLVAKHRIGTWDGLVWIAYT